MITSDETTNPVEHDLVVKLLISFFTVQLTASITQFTMHLKNTSDSLI